MLTEIERLRQENAELREALGLADINQTALSIAQALGIIPQAASVVQALYAARGAWVPLNTLVELIDPQNRLACPENQVGVMLWRARKALGQDAIETQYGARRLTPAAIELVARAIDAPREAI
jgi:hypothetical protein